MVLEKDKKVYEDFNSSKKVIQPKLKNQNARIASTNKEDSPIMGLEQTKSEWKERTSENSRKIVLNPTKSPVEEIKARANQGYLTKAQTLINLCNPKSSLLLLNCLISWGKRRRSPSFSNFFSFFSLILLITLMMTL